MQKLEIGKDLLTNDSKLTDWFRHNVHFFINFLNYKKLYIPYCY